MSGWFEHYGFAEVGDNLLMGAYPQDADDVAELSQAGVTRIFNLVQDIEYEPGARDGCVAALAAAGIDEQRVELVDFGSVPAAQIERRRRPSCAGSTRASACTCTAARAGSARRPSSRRSSRCARASTSAKALQVLRERKPTANPLMHQRADLLDWWLLRRARAEG